METRSTPGFNTLLLQHAFNTTSSFRVVIDQKKQQFVAPNRALCAGLGYSEEEIVALPPGAISDVFLGLMTEKDTLLQIVPSATLRRKDGSNCTVQMQGESFEYDRRSYLLVTATPAPAAQDMKASEGLACNEQFLRTLVEYKYDAVTVLDEEGKMMFASPAIQNILGYSPEEALQLAPFAVVLPEDTDHVQACFAKSLQQPGAPVKNIVYPAHHKNGELKWLQSNFTNYLHHPAVTGIIHNFIDVTEAKLKELQLSAIADNVKGVLFRYRLNSDGTDELLGVSKGAVNIWGIEAGDAMKNNDLVWDRIVKEDEQRLRITIEESAKEMKAFVAEWRFVMPAGAVRWHKCIGNPQKLDDGAVLWDSLIIDITDAKKAEEKISFQARLLNTIGQAVIATDTGGHVSYWNKAAEHLYGWMETEAMGRNIIDLTPSNQTKKQAEQLLTGMKKGQTWSGEFKVQHKSGNEFLAYVTDTAIYDADGNLTGIIGISTDISEQKKNEREMTLLLNNTEEAFVLLDFGLTIVSFNYQFDKSYQRFFNKQVKKGTSILEYAQPGRLPMVKNIYERVLSGHKEESEIAVDDPNDGLSYFRFIFSPARDEQKNIIGAFVTVADITQHRKAEEERLAEQMNKEALINTTDDFIWSLDNGFKLVAANDAFIQSVKKTSGLTVKKGDTLIMEGEYSPEWLQFWKDHYLRALSGESFTEEIHTQIEDSAIDRWDETVFKPVVNGERIIGVACYSRNITQRKEIEKGERERLLQQQLFTSIVQSSDDGIVSKNLDGIITSWNKGAEKIFGYTAEEVIGKSISIIIPPELAHEEAEIINQITQKQFVRNLETERITKTGSRVHISLTVSPLLDSDGNVTGASNIVRNITERRRIEQQINRSEERYRTLFQQSLAGFYEAAEDGELLNCNDAFAAMLKYNAPSELIHKNLCDIYFSPDEKERLFQLMATNKKIQNHEGILKCKDGSPLYFIENITLRTDSDTGVTVLDGIILNISEKKLAELALQKSNERYNLVSKATNDVIWDWDLNTGEVLRNDEIMEKAFGYTKEDHTSSFNFWWQHTHPGDTDRINALFAKTFANPTEKFMDCEYRFQKKDGTYAYVYDKGYVVRNEEGKPVRAIGAVQDITTLKENETLLHQRAAELEASNRELEQFAYVASHDLQEPLRMVTSFLSQLHKKYNDTLDDRAKRYIHFAIDGASRMRHIILDLLDYSRAGRVVEKVEAVDLNSIVDEVKILFKQKIREKKASISSDVLPVVQAHSSPLRQLLQNLIGNALTYSNKDQQPVIHISVEDKQTHWQFAIADNGIGIDEEYFTKIFVIFQRLHSRDEYAGTGMGLAIAKKIIETFGGDIWVTSKEGIGSTFYFTLPK